MRKLSTIAATAMIGFSSSLFAKEPISNFQELTHCPPCPVPVVLDDVYATQNKKFVTATLTTERPGWSPDWGKYDQHKMSKPQWIPVNNHTSRRYL